MDNRVHWEVTLSISIKVIGTYMYLKLSTQKLKGWTRRRNWGFPLFTVMPCKSKKCWISKRNWKSGRIRYDTRWWILQLFWIFPLFGFPFLCIQWLKASLSSVFFFWIWYLSRYIRFSSHFTCLFLCMPSRISPLCYYIIEILKKMFLKKWKNVKTACFNRPKSSWPC